MVHRSSGALRGGLCDIRTVKPPLAAALAEDGMRLGIRWFTAATSCGHRTVTGDRGHSRSSLRNLPPGRSSFPTAILYFSFKGTRSSSSGSEKLPM